MWLTEALCGYYILLHVFPFSGYKVRRTNALLWRGIALNRLISSTRRASRQHWFLILAFHAISTPEDEHGKR